MITQMIFRMNAFGRRNEEGMIQDYYLKVSGDLGLVLDFFMGNVYILGLLGLSLVWLLANL